jgi:type II secretory pathway component PulM
MEMREIWDGLRVQRFGLELFKRLSKREQLFTATGGILLFCLLGYFLMVNPMLERMKTTDRLILQKEEELNEMARLKKEYDQLQGRLKGIEVRLSQQPGNFSLLSYLEGTANSTQIRKNISSMRPQPSGTDNEHFRENSVEVRIENVSLFQVVEFLGAIERSPTYLRVKQVRLKTRYSDPNAMDATFLISSYEGPQKS